MKSELRVDLEKIARLKQQIKNSDYMNKELSELAKKLSEDF